MAKHLTARQVEILEMLRTYIKENQESPTLSELQMMLNIKTKRGVAKHLEALDRKGYIYRTGTPRGIKVIDDEDNMMLKIPILGYANAGTPLVFAEEEIIGSIQVDRDFIKSSKKHFGLIVKGDSMNLKTINKVSIVDKSYVIVEENTGNINDGDVVLAVIDNAATIKTFKKSKNSIILYPQSNNPVHTPLYLREDTSGFINGKVIAVLENPGS